MKTYKIEAGETVYHRYEVEIKAKNKEQAKKIAENKPTSEWDDEETEHAGDFTIDEIEEVE